MRSRTTLIGLGVAIALVLVNVAASAHYLIPVDPKCNYKSLLHPDCIVCATDFDGGITNFTRDYPMGKGYPPSINSISLERTNPYPGEYANILINATSDGGASDGVGAQRIMAVEVAYSLVDGKSWYTNNWDGTKVGPGIPADFFRREKMTPKNAGTVKYVMYESTTKPWAVSPESVAFATGSIPAPNRRCELTPALCNKAAYPFPYSDDCPWGLSCPLYDTFYPNKGESAGTWPASTCSQSDGECNVPGFPEGGGDILDNFPSLDPYPMDDFPNVPGEPLIRVNGVPGVDCDIYNGTYIDRPLHPLCNVPIPPDDKKAYEKFGVYSYKITPGSGLVRFSYALDPLDNVDASFYSGDMSAWTAKLDLTTLPLSDINEVGGSFVFHVKAYDTCGNMASGAQSPPYPPFPGENNQAYIGVYDFYYDQVPTDQDPMGQIAKDDGGTQCSATDTYCPADGMTIRERVDKPVGWCQGAAEAGCECCYNECAPSRCSYNGNIRNDVRSMCSNVGASGNPPGCGPEFDHQDGDTHYGTQEIREFKMSHTAANLYLKTTVQGDILWGCYGSWYPLIGCEYSFGTLGSKFGGYAAQLLNTASDPPSTYYLIVIPDIPIYGSMPLLIDLNKMLEELMGSAYDGQEMERYADGGGCKKPDDGDTDPVDPCEELGCNPDDNASGDCDGDGYVNGTDSCPCEEASDTDDGCPAEDPGGGDPLADYKCNSCQTGTQGSSLYVEIGIEDTLGDAQGGAYRTMAMTLTIHDLNMDWLLYYACLNGMNLLALAQDQSPRINYYPFGDRARMEAELVQDYTPPEELRSDKTMACLGRCDENDLADGADNDDDLATLEPVASRRIDEGYDPTALQFEFQFQEAVVNNDAYKSNLTDLGGYQMQIGRDPDGPFETYYVMCSPTEDADCYGFNNLCDESTTCAADGDCDPGKSCIDNYCCMGGDRNMPAYDEPYANRSRFPNPFDESAPHNGYGFPGEMISCVIDSDCDISSNLFNDDKDNFKDEGCWAPNCYDNNTTLLPDGQAYWMRVRAFDIPKEIATDTALINYTSYTTPTKVQILRNTYPPDPPDVVASYQMVYGGKAKVVWNPNHEHDIGGYAIYRCPANPIDSVIKTIDGTLAAYCAEEKNFRLIHEDILDNLNGYFVDDGMGYYETGIGDGTATGPLVMTWSTCSIQNTTGQYIVDEKCNWDPNTHDLGVDATAGGITLGEGDGVPTPAIPGIYDGESFAYEWIDCTDLTVSGGLNEDLKLCGNIQDPNSGGWWASSTELFDTEGDPLYIFDVTDPAVNPGYDPAAHAPVLFYNGLVDGYKYYYLVKAVDSPYLGDGWNDISASDKCDDGITAYSATPSPDGCINPISSRTCQDKRIAYDWTAGGNCSANSSIMETVPADTQMPQSPNSVNAEIQPSGTAVKLEWNTPEEDRTMTTFNVYRASNQGDGLYACVHGGCESAPYADGCPCDPTKDVNTQCFQDATKGWSRKCDKPYKICTNPPFYTIEPQTQGCDTAPYNPGCLCETDADCGTCGTYTSKTNCETFGCNWDSVSSSCSGLKCTNQVSICMIDANVANSPGIATYAFENDRMDNDGDGLIDEEADVNGIDEDGDGLVDEDVGAYVNGETIVGYCPGKTYPYWDEKNWRSQERILSNTFTDNSVEPGKIYRYRIQAVDNAVYDPNDFSLNDVDPPPPNYGIMSQPIVVDMTDTLPPNNVTGYCAHAVTGLPMPCVSIMDVATYEFACNDNIEDFEDDNYGSKLSVRWRRNSDSDVYGYYVYRASDVTNSGIEPPSGAFSKVNDVIITQSEPDVATDAICFKDSGLTNGIDYYYAVTVVDVQGNESPFSEVSGPTKAEDSIAPMTPTWGSGGGAVPDVTASKITVTWEDHENYAASKLAVSDPSETDFSHFSIYRSADDDVCEASELCSNSGTCSTSADCATGKTCYQGLCCDGGTTCCGGEYTDSSFVDGFIAKDTEYYYCIAAFDTNDNESAPLEMAAAVKAVDQVPPLAPTGLVASRMTNSVIGLGWKQSPEDDLLCYKPYFSSTSTNTGTFSPVDLKDTDIGYTTVTNIYNIEIECLDELYYLDSSVTSTGNVYYRLTAIDEKGNESALSNYVVTMTTTQDFYAPPYPDKLYTRAGFHRGENGAAANDGVDNDSNGFIDDALINLKTKYAELYWDRVREPDVAKYEIYIRRPPDAANCSDATCDVDAAPLGDCDNDGTVNSIDDCPCTPTNPSTSQFGDYELYKEIDVDDNCPTAKARPTDTQKGDICLLDIKDAQCENSRYWYSVVPVDEAGNTDGLNKSYAMAATTTPNPDNESPDKPSKPKVAVTQGGKSLVVKFQENPEEDPNLDLAGYIIYRDNRPTGDFLTKLAVINDTSKLKYCVQANQPPCYCDEVAPEYACLLDISVEEGKRYYYKVSAFDFNSNESEMSDWAYAIPSPEAPDNVTGFTATPKKNNDFALNLSWNPGNLLDDQNVAGFRIYRAAAESGTYQLIDPVPDTTAVEPLRASSFLDTGLVRGSTYWYMILTYTTDGLESPDEKTCGVAGTDIFPPSTPSGVKVSNGNKEVTLSWSAVPDTDLAGYNIYRSLTRDFKNSTKVNTGDVTYPVFTDSDLTNNTAYYYCVRAYDNGPDYDTSGCYTNFSTESACSSPATLAYPNNNTSTTSKLITVSRGWNLLAAQGDPSVVPVSENASDPTVSASKSLVKLSKNGGTVSTGDSPEALPAAGSGLWYYSMDTQEIVELQGAFVPSGAIDIDLEDGWNLIGSPFMEAIIWNDENISVSTDGGATFSAVSSVSSIQGAYIWDPASSSYLSLKTGDTLNPGTGVFVKSSGAAMLRMIRE